MLCTVFYAYVDDYYENYDYSDHGHHCCDADDVDFDDGEVVVVLGWDDVDVRVK